MGIIRDTPTRVKGRVSARQWARQQQEIHKGQLRAAKGDASKVIQSLNIQSGRRYFLVARVSSSDQHKNENLLNQIVKLPEIVEAGGGKLPLLTEAQYLRAGGDLARMERRGAKVLPLFAFEQSGQGKGWLAKLAKVCALAKSYNATVLAATPSRLVRHGDFNSQHPVYRAAQPTDKELDALRKAADGTTLMTVCDPNASPSEDLALLAKWGQDVKEDQGGRPIMGRDKRRQKYMPMAWRLRDWFGWTQAKIAEVISGWAKHPVSQPTIGKWLKRRPKP